MFPSYFANLQFLFTLLAAILCAAIVILWGGYGFPPGMRNFNSYVIFTHTAPAYNIILWGFILSYILGEEPSPKLQMIYSAPGCLFFFIVAGLQVRCLDDYTGPKVLVLFTIHVGVFLLLAALLFLAFRKSLNGDNKEDQPYIVRVSRGGVPQYRSYN